MLKELLEQHISDNCSNQIKKQIDVNEKEINGLEKWKWTVGGVLLAMTFLMTASQTFGIFN